MISVTWNDEFKLPDCSYSISDEKIVEMLRNYNYKTGNLLDYLYHQKYYKLIRMDLPKQTNKNIPKQINCVGKLKEDYGATMFLTLKSIKKLF